MKIILNSLNSAKSRRLDSLLISDEVRPRAKSNSIIAISIMLLMSGCSGKSSSAKWLEIGSTGQLINLDKVTDIIPGHDPNKLIWGNNTSGYIRFFNPRETSVSFPNEKAANDSYLRIIYFLKSNDRYLKL